MKFFPTHSEGGQTLVEIVIGVAILSTVMLSATTVAVSSSKAGTDSYDYLRAGQLAEEGIEEMRNIRDTWIKKYPQGSIPEDPLNAGNFGKGDATDAGRELFFSPNCNHIHSTFIQDDNTWLYDRHIGHPGALNGPPYSVNPDVEYMDTSGNATDPDGAIKFTRRLFVCGLAESGNSLVIQNGSTTEGIEDVNYAARKQITAEVSWTDQNGTPQSVSLSSIVVDYQGINPSLPPVNPPPPSSGPVDQLVINVTPYTYSGAPQPTMTVIARRGGTTVTQVFSYPPRRHTSCPPYDSAETCNSYTETMNLGPTIPDARTLTQIEIVFSNDAFVGPCSPDCSLDNNLVINSVVAGGVSAGQALKYYKSDSTAMCVQGGFGAIPACSSPVTMTDNGSAYWISAPDRIAPTAPSGLTATTLSASRIRLNWTAATDDTGVTSYNIFRGGAFIGTSATRSFTDTGLAQGTTYSYQVQAVDAAGNVGPLSNTASATTSWGNVNIGSFTADSTNFDSGGSTTLRWGGVTNATSCSGSGTWGGGKSIPSGTEGTGGLGAGSYTYTLTCSNPTSSDSRNVTITVNNPSPPFCGPTAGGSRAGQFVTIDGGGSGCAYYLDSYVGWNGGFGGVGPIFSPGQFCHTQQGGRDPWGLYASATWCG